MEKLRKGLKEGDYFEDGGRLFVIDEVKEEGKYVSHQIEPEEVEMTVAELKEELKEMGLSTSGNKAELNERLVAAYEEYLENDDPENDDPENEEPEKKEEE